MTTHQVFCSVSDLIADMDMPGGDEARLYQAIREASQTVRDEIGDFIPVTRTFKMRGNGKDYLYPFPPVLSLTSITNDDTALTENTDFVFMRQMWENGPYIGMERLSDSPNASNWCDTDPDSIVIVGETGLYSRKVATGATLSATITDTAAEMTVSNGSKVSPGMIVEIGTEKILITGWGDPTASVTTLAAALDATSDQATMTSAADLNAGETLRLDFENVRLRAKRTNLTSLTRNWNNTGQVAHLIATAVDVYRTVTIERGVNGTTAASHASGAAISRYVVPDNVFKLVKKMAVLGINQANSNYAGRSGDAEQGTVYYHDLYPRWDLERLKTEYWLAKS